MTRWSVNQHSDARYFRNTASTTKAININSRPMRGGIRL